MRLVAFVRDPSVYESEVQEDALLGAVNADGDYRIVKNSNDTYILGHFTPLYEGGQWVINDPIFTLDPTPISADSTFVENYRSSNFNINLASILPVYSVVQRDIPILTLLGQPVGDIGTNDSEVSVIVDDTAPYYSFAE